MPLNEFKTFLESGINPSAYDDVYPPEIRDLYRLYKFVREKRIVSCLEFGSGWSTLVIAKGLQENKESWSQWLNTRVRHPNPFKLLTVDSSEHYQKIALERVTRLSLDKGVEGVISTASMTMFDSRACHLFDNVPPFTADLIYLDGPDCSQVEGDVNGFNLQFGDTKKLYGLPMAADILVLEPFLWPGTVILIDGRGANARFLRTHLSRKWKYSYNNVSDQHLFTLDELPWGKYSRNLLRLRKVWRIGLATIR